MKEVLEKINGLQNQITELNHTAFKELCTIIKDVCSVEDYGVKKIGNGCFVVMASTIIGNPWSVEYVSNEVAGGVLIDKVTNIFAHRERIEDVLEYLNDVVAKAANNYIMIEVGHVKTLRGTLTTDKRVIKKSLVEKILAFYKQN